MELNNMVDRLSRLKSMVERWNELEGVPQIERDIVLEELRHLYGEVLGYEAPAERTAIVAPPVKTERVEETIAPEPEPEPEPEIESVNDLGDAFDDALDIDAILGIGSDEPGEITIEEISEPEPDPEPEPEPEPDPAP
ncbi:MAG: hypothetical protein IJ464_06240, partial [Alistipes sp.]|nr:hypothetical protein [Alistipes sp.]